MQCVIVSLADVGACLWEKNNIEWDSDQDMYKVVSARARFEDLRGGNARVPRRMSPSLRLLSLDVVLGAPRGKQQHVHSSQLAGLLVLLLHLVQQLHAHQSVTEI